MDITQLEFRRACLLQKLQLILRYLYMENLQSEYGRDNLRRHRLKLTEQLVQCADQIAVIDSQILEADLSASESAGSLRARVWASLSHDLAAILSVWGPGLTLFLASRGLFMSENNITRQTRGVTLRELKDVRRVCQRIVSKAFQEGEELQYSGRIAQLMACWMKAWELDKLADIETRLTALEAKEATSRPQGGRRP